MKTEQGASLIETLVSMLILSIALLGVDAMQIMSLRASRSAYYFSVAEQQISNLIERLHAAGREEAKAQINSWNEENKVVLPSGRGGVEENKIMIFWGGYRGRFCDKNTIQQAGCLRMELPGP